VGTGTAADFRERDVRGKASSRTVPNPGVRENTR